MSPAKVAKHSHRSLTKLLLSIVLQVVILVIAIKLLLPQAKEFLASWRSFTSPNIWWVLLSAFSIAGTVMFATGVYMVLIPVHLSFRKTLIIQLATYFSNKLLPSGLGGLGLNTLYLIKQAKLSKTDATVYATANNIIGFIAFMLCVLLITTTGASHISASIPIKKILLITALLGIVVGLVSLLFRQVQKRIVDFAGHLLGVILTIFRHPKRLGISVLISTGITLSYTICLWASARSMGVYIPFADIFIAFVAGNTALTISPTPGGIGAVEATIAGVLTTAGVPMSLAFATVLMYRAISYWLPIIPGYVAFLVATKKHYV